MPAMSLTIGPAFTIPEYTTVAAPVYDSECEATVYAADVVWATRPSGRTTWPAHSARTGRRTLPSRSQRP